MGMKLIIAEKPSVGDAIAQALGGFDKAKSGKFFSNKKDCIITWAFGHLVELYHPTHSDINKLPMLPKDDDWQLNIINGSGYQEQFDVIKSLVDNNNVTEIVNACDAGREGEFIGRLIYLKTGTQKPLYRMWINSMTKGGLIEAYKGITSADKYEGLNQSAFCRSKMDWLIGLNGSIGTTLVLAKKEDLSQVTEIGRVKTAVLAMVVQKEREILNFVSEKFWEIEGNFKAKSADADYLGKWVNYSELQKKRATKPAADDGASDGAGNEKDEDSNESNSLYRFKDQSSVKRVVDECKIDGNWKNPTKVLENKTARKRNAPHLFDLAAIQVLANKLYKFSSKQTLDLVQELYEKHQAVTYPRTESQHLPSDYPNECRKILTKLAEAKHNSAVCDFANEALERVGEVGKHIFDDKKITDHFAIIPTGVVPNLEGNANAKKIYHLIVRRFKEAFLPPQEYNETERFTFIDNHAFRSVGEEITNIGWKIIGDKEGESSTKKGDTLLPSVQDHSDVITLAVKSIQKKTTPPSRFNNGTLLNTMKFISRTLSGDQKDALKSCGIGTPATRATIIDELHATASSNGRPKKAMLEERGRSKEIFPTDYGMRVISFLEENKIMNLITPEFTADLEMGLEEVRQDASKSVAFMRHTHEIVTDFIKKLQNAHANIPVRIFSGAKCPKCQSNLTVEPRFIDCSSCSFKINRVVADKTLTTEELSVLITNKQTGVLDGFVKKAKGKVKAKHFSAGLKMELDEQGRDVIKFYFPKEKFKHDCPICNSEMMKTVNGIECQNASCKLMVWSTSFGKRLTDSHIEKLICEGLTDQIDGFISIEKKTEYSARLKIDHANKKVALSFENVTTQDEGTQTKFKCMSEGCNGCYVKTKFRYTCNTCNTYINYKMKDQSPFTDAQMKKMFKGETVMHVLNEQNESGDVVKKNYNFHINKSGYLRKVEVEGV